MYTSYTEAVQAASALLNYYQTDSMIARDCEWVYHTSDAFTVYEYTQAPTAYTVYTVTPTAVSYTTSPDTMLDFGGLTFLLDGQYPQGGEDPNFWFRIEASDPALVEANGELSATFIQRTEATFSSGSDLVITQEYPIVSDVSGDGSWVSVCPYGNNEGWFVYGRASTGTFVSTELQTEEPSFLPLNLPVLHMPDETLSDSELARFLTDHYVHIIQLQSNNKSRGIAAYPPVSELLSRENGISALLALAQGDYTSSSLVSTFNGGAMFLLTLPCIQQRMNGEQLQAMDRMNVQSYFYAYSFPNSLDELKKEIPENLTDIPAEELNIWIGVFLKSGAQLLRQPDWTLEAQLLSGEGTLFVWEFYDSTVDAVTGWMVSGKVSDVQSVLLRLKQGDTTLELQEVTPVLFTNAQ